jgi:precorrin-6y C5,15-methyltransferase (decarboxylating) CbiE subunit
MVNIVALGPGNKDYILPVATKQIEKSEYIVGFSRALEGFEESQATKVKVKSLKEIIDFILINEDKEVSILASGDPLFYGITNYIKLNYKGYINVIPGISSFQYLMAKLTKPWQNAELGSLHGREEAFLQVVIEKKLSIWLTDNKNTPQSMCKKLFDNNIEAKIYIGENLSYEDEKITSGSPGELMNKEFTRLSVFVVERPGE